MRTKMLLPALLGLAACASQVEWSKPGVSAEQLEKDKLACTKEIPKAGGSASAPTTSRIRVVEPKCMEALGYTKG